MGFLQKVTLMVIVVLSAILVGCTPNKPQENIVADPRDVWYPILVGLDTGLGDQLFMSDGQGTVIVLLYNPYSKATDTQIFNETTAYTVAQVWYFESTLLLNFNENYYPTAGYTLKEYTFEPTATLEESFECPGTCTGTLNQGRIEVSTVTSLPSYESTGEMWSILPEQGERQVTIYSEGTGHDIFVQLLTAEGDIETTLSLPSWVDTIVTHQGTWVRPVN